jgi:uncharacterized protein YceK
MKTASIGVALICLSACGTVADCASNHDVAFDSPGPHIYGGVRLDAVAGTKPFGSHGSSPLGPLHWLDIPFSLALDTVLLPVTAVWSCFPEGREYVTLDRRGLDQVVTQEQLLPYHSALQYLGTEAGYHHLQFSRFNRAVTRYRIHESLLSVERPFPYTSDQAKAIVVKGRNDPWPLPEPLKARQN